MSSADWLKKYYGEDFEELNPVVVINGKKKAVVKITKVGQRGFSGTGFVLLSKNGKYRGSPQKSLHEGVPSKLDMERMEAALKKADK